MVITVGPDLGAALMSLARELSDNPASRGALVTTLPYLLVSELLLLSGAPVADSPDNLTALTYLPSLAARIRHMNATEAVKGHELCRLIEVGMTRRQVDAILVARPKIVDLLVNARQRDCLWPDYRLEVTFDMVSDRVLARRWFPPPR
jgi:hypothetical protein